MTEAVKIITFINLIFLILLLLSGSVSGIVGEVIRYAAFIIPIFIGFYSSRELQKKREAKAGIAEGPDTLLSFDFGRFVRLLPLVSPLVLLIFTVSFITSLILTLIGAGSDAVENTDIIRMLLVHALAPAFFEEALFRYIPMKLLAPYSKRWCVLYSALCFSLIHCSLFQMPYAFVAGLVFMSVDIAFGSVWPSVILHLINNTASVVWMKYCSGMTASWIFIAVLLLLSLVSLVFIIKNRREYKELFASAFDKGDGFTSSPAPMALVVICGYIAIANLF